MQSHNQQQYYPQQVQSQPQAQSYTKSPSQMQPSLSSPFSNYSYSNSMTGGSGNANIGTVGGPSPMNFGDASNGNAQVSPNTALQGQAPARERVRTLYAFTRNQVRLWIEIW